MPDCHAEWAGAAFPNGTIGCGDRSHSVGEPPPPGLRGDDRIRWIVDHAPPLSAEQRDRLRMLLAPAGAGGAVADGNRARGRPTRHDANRGLPDR